MICWASQLIAICNIRHIEPVIEVNPYLAHNQLICHNFSIDCTQNSFIHFWLNYGTIRNFYILPNSNEAIGKVTVAKTLMALYILYILPLEYNKDLIIVSTHHISRLDWNRTRTNETVLTGVSKCLGMDSLGAVFTSIVPLRDATCDYIWLVVCTVQGYRQHSLIHTNIHVQVKIHVPIRTIGVQI